LNEAATRIISLFRMVKPRNRFKRKVHNFRIIMKVKQNCASLI